MVRGGGEDLHFQLISPDRAVFGSNAQGQLIPPRNSVCQVQRQGSHGFKTSLDMHEPNQLDSHADADAETSNQKLYHAETAYPLAVPSALPPFCPHPSLPCRLWRDPARTSSLGGAGVRSTFSIWLTQASSTGNGMDVT